ncbi:MAG: bifunctional phosphoribosylaminoimidazolecarboxamide formyltransferase/IMP cyclohydrolase [Pirellulales bacterium]
MQSPPVRRALISVSDKLGLADFARGLAAAGVEIYSTGGTRKHLESEGLAVRDVSDYTGFPEMMDGRLKTLHPKVFGGILCRHNKPSDMEALAKHGILTFELIVVNLYPFEATVAREGVTDAEAIEQIDIGGPSLIRAASKNHAFTTVATAAEQYSAILEEITANGATSLELRRRLAAAAFATTARYDQAIAAYFAGQTAEGPFPGTINLGLRRKAVLRYGENPHQRAALYASADGTGANLVSARQLSGKELSYNNLLDLDSALAIARSLPDAAAVVIKHNNPCGAASASTLAEATKQALAGDPLSAFGSVLGFNRPVDAATAEVLSEPGLFIEAIVAPEYAPDALEILSTRPKWKANVRLLKVGQLDDNRSPWEFRQLEGGFLMQERDLLADPEGEWKVVTERKPNPADLVDLRIAWSIVRHVKSNAIVLCQGRALWGAGAGQMSRVDSVEIAIKKAGEHARGAALGSDAFFPFADSIEQAAAAGVASLIQPGGSKRDDEVIAACNKVGLAMIFTGRRHFKH